MRGKNSYPLGIVLAQKRARFSQVAALPLDTSHRLVLLRQVVFLVRIKSNKVHLDSRPNEMNGSVTAVWVVVLFVPGSDGIFFGSPLLLARCAFIIHGVCSFCSHRQVD